MAETQSTAEGAEIVKRPTLDQIFKQLKIREMDPANPEDYIKVDFSRGGQELIDSLMAVGTSMEDVRRGYITRGQLLKAGFVFNNVIGGGEKPIIAVVINGEDFGKKSLLTKEELELVTQYQKDNGYVPKSIDFDDLRRDMVGFILANTSNRPMGLWNRNNARRIVFGDVIQDKAHAGRVSRIDRVLVNLYEDYLRKDWIFIDEKGTTRVRVEVEQKYFDDNFGDVFPWKSDYNPFSGNLARDVRVSVLPSRMKALDGTPSPFLDSGFLFSLGGDLTIFDANDKAYRLNMAVFHLALRGLNEMGDGGSASYDQHYLTVDEYSRLIYIEDEAERKSEREKEECRWQSQGNIAEVYVHLEERVVDLARKWAKSDKAPFYIRNMVRALRR